MRFTKMQAAGNDYVYMDTLKAPISSPEALARRISDRHFGVGSDGLILICPPSDPGEADFRMRMFNADGSEAEMCGNGIRCVGKYVYDNGHTDKEQVRIETLAGVLTLRLHVSGGKVDAFAEAKEALGDRLIDLRAAMQAAVTDGSAARESADGGVFFRTDHHWSGYGAYLGYAGFLQARAGVSLSDDTSRRVADGKAAQIAGSESAGQEARNVNGSFAAKAAPSYAKLAPTVLSDDFYGTLYSKVLLTTLTKDSVETPGAALTAKYQVRLNGETYDSLYFNEYLHKKDKYAVYFGGNYDKVDIEIGETTGQAAQMASSKGSLLILKDSFANSFVPYLLGDYSRITMIDSRYYRGSVTELAEDYDEVLVLYGIDNFAGEKLHLSKSLIK